MYVRSNLSRINPPPMVRGLLFLIIALLVVSCAKADDEDSGVKAVDAPNNQGSQSEIILTGSPEIELDITAVILPQMSDHPIHILGLSFDSNPPPAKFSSYQPVIVHTETIQRATNGKFFKLAGSALLAKNLGDEAGYQFQMILNEKIAALITQRIEDESAAYDLDVSQLDKMDIFYLLALATGLHPLDDAGDYLIPSALPKPGLIEGGF